VEYGLHCVLWLVQERDQSASSRDLADLQGVPANYMARIMPKLTKAGLVVATSGINGGYRLAKDASQITVLDIVDAIEGHKRVFNCREVRQNCVLFGGAAPGWISQGVCGVHSVMIRAEAKMRDEMSKTTLLDLAHGFKPPKEFGEAAESWLADRAAGRENARLAAMRGRSASGDIDAK
jgi:Rrf2 family protein